VENLRLPDSSVQTRRYGFGVSPQNQQSYQSWSIDFNRNPSEQFQNERGLVTAVVQHNPLSGHDTLNTLYKYNAINELVEVEDDQGYKTTTKHDKAGRREFIDSPDTGLTTFKYNKAHQLIEKITANLQGGTGIEYDYDFNRLERITYPQNPQNNVRYHYGAPGADNRTVGRISRIEDATGQLEYQYGPLGEITQADRTITYDNIGRFQTTRGYRSQPDGERLVYDYDRGGKLKQIRGVKGLESESKSHYQYLDNLTYDKFGQRVYVKYGNGTETKYDYESDRRRLSQMQVISNADTYQRRLGGSHQFIDNHHGYDRNGNVTQLDNRAQAASFTSGGSTQQTFSYDNLNQLLTASGSFLPSNNRQERYTLNMQYDRISNIIGKDQTHETAKHL